MAREPFFHQPLRHRIRRKALEWLIAPPPVRARHFEYSILYSLDDSGPPPSDRLLELATSAIAAAKTANLSTVEARMGNRFPEVRLSLWPGEHYSILAALCSLLEPSVVVEIGTAEGLSALSMLTALPPQSTLVTFDLVPWQRYPRCCLTEEDFRGGRLEQRIANLADPVTFAANLQTLSKAALIFMDGPKDGVFEPSFLQLLSKNRPPGGSLLVLDDIRIWNMLGVWRKLPFPKLDLTSFGHWLGTGLVLI